MSLRNVKMSAQEKTKQVSKGTLSSVLSEMQKNITEFNNRIPDFIGKIFSRNFSRNVVIFLCSSTKKCDHNCDQALIKSSWGSV